MKMMAMRMAWLAAGELTAAERGKLLWALGILLLIVVVGGVALMVFRRRLTEKESGNKSMDAGFSLSDLRAMRDRGEITAEEYERTRARVVARVKGRVEEPRDEAEDPPT
jgi:hypothetical protein